MTKVVFETATLADAIKKADKVAPGKGKAFDEAGGIVMEVDPEGSTVVLRATDQTIFYREWVDVLEIEGDARVWRLPNMMVTPVVASLPIGSGKTISFEEKDNGFSSYIEFRSGRTKGKFNLMDMAFYPDWDVFDPDGLTSVTDMGGKVGMVEWAVSKDQDPITGVHFTGKEVQATDKYRLAIVPLEINGMESPVTVPGGTLTTVLPKTGDVMVGFTPTQMLIMPNDTTQVRAVLLGSKYPNLEKVMQRDQEASVQFKKQELLDIINRAIIAASTDRLPAMRMFFGKEQIAVLVQHEASSSTILDSISVPGYCVHDRVEIMFTPKNLTEVLQNAPNDSVTLHYNLGKNQIVYVNGGSGYEAWAVVRTAVS